MSNGDPLHSFVCRGKSEDDEQAFADELDGEVESFEGEFLRVEGCGGF
jgi:hypothetical protein